MRPFPVQALLALALLTVAARAHAYTTWSSKQQNGELKFKINVNDFTSKVRMSHATSAGDFENWIRWSVGQWRERSGANITATYNGRTTAAGCHLDVIGGSANLPVADRDGVNTIDATDQCFPGTNGPQCWVGGRVYAHVENGIIKEVDLCIFRTKTASNVVVPYAIATDTNTFENSKDLLATLTHEVGHMYGMDHSDIAATVMMQYGSDFLRARFLTFDDIQGIQSKYGGRSSAAGWGPVGTAQATFFAPVGAHQTPSAALGTIAGGGNRLAASGVTIMDGSPTLTVASTATPPSINSTWSTRQFFNSDYPLAITAATNKSEWLGVAAVRPTPSFGDLHEVCPPTVVVKSTDAFVNLSALALVNSVCAQHRLAVAYDPVSQRWVLVYTDLFTQTLHVTTSRDGTTWTTPQDIELFAYGGAALACDSSGCVTTFPFAGTVGGEAATVVFYVGNDGSVLPVAGMTETNHQFHVPTLGASKNGVWWQGLTATLDAPERHYLTDVILGSVTGQTGTVAVWTGTVLGMPAIAASPSFTNAYWIGIWN